jgi:hypothetical protein
MTRMTLGIGRTLGTLAPLVVGFTGLGVALAVLWMAPPAVDPALVRPWMHRLDLDHDGCICAEEVRQMSDEIDLFPILDYDHSGCLEPAEIETLLLHIDPKRFEAAAL